MSFDVDRLQVQNRKSRGQYVRAVSDESVFVLKVAVDNFC